MVQPLLTAYSASEQHSGHVGTLVMGGRQGRGSKWIAHHVDARAVEARRKEPALYKGRDGYDVGLLEPLRRRGGAIERADQVMGSSAGAALCERMDEARQAGGTLAGCVWQAPPV